MNRQKLILAILAILLVLALFSSYLRTPRQKTVDKLTYAPGATAPAVVRNQSQTPQQAVQGGTLRLDLLDRPLVAHPVKRDILRPIFVDESKVAAQKAAQAKVVKPPPPPPPPPPPTPQEIARQQIGQFKSLGMLRKNDKHIAFLARGTEIVLVKVGESPIQGYRASSIDDQSLTLRAINGTDEIIFSLR